MKSKRLLIAVLLIAAVCMFVSCGRSEEPLPADAPVVGTQEETEPVIEEEPEQEAPEEQPAEPAALDPVSLSLTADGRWLTAVNETYANPAGLNESPALSFNEIPGAYCYAIYMIDVSASNWVHWIARNVTVTELAQGAGPEDSEYIGPYPPSGVHTYEIHIYALAAEPDSYPGTVNGTLSSIADVKSALDTAGGTNGNIITSAVLSGTVESGGAPVE